MENVNALKKKKTIFWSCISGVALILSILAVALIPMFLSFSYSSAYRAAKDLKEDIHSLLLV